MLANPQRLLVETLRWACSLGAVALNYMGAEELLVEKGRAVGICAVDAVSGKALNFHGGAVVNCCGPWARSLAKRFDHDIASMTEPFLMSKVVLDREPPSDFSIAVESKGPGTRAYFLFPMKGKTMVGSYHGTWDGNLHPAPPSRHMLKALLDDLNSAIPGLSLHGSEILRVLYGLVPSAKDGGNDLAIRPVFYEHGRKGGVERLISIRGTKYCTARSAAEKVLRRLYKDRWGKMEYRRGSERPKTNDWLDLDEPHQMLTMEDTQLGLILGRIVEEESVVYLDDLLLRRTDWLFDPRFEPQVTERVRDVLPRLTLHSYDFSNSLGHNNSVISAGMPIVKGRSI
jgi:glycerol-3-phosphate dehydrogenase